MISVVGRAISVTLMVNSGPTIIKCNNDISHTLLKDGASDRESLSKIYSLIKPKSGGLLSLKRGWFSKIFKKKYLK